MAETCEISAVNAKIWATGTQLNMDYWEIAAYLVVSGYIRQCFSSELLKVPVRGCD